MTHTYFLVTPDDGRKVAGPYDSWEAADTDRRGADLLIEASEQDPNPDD